MTAQRRLVVRLIGAVVVAFFASMALTWILHDRMTAREAYKLIDGAFNDVERAIRERVDRRMIRQAMVVRDRLHEMVGEPWWGDPAESSRRLRALADELMVNEICVADADGLLTHSARVEEVGKLNFRQSSGQAGEFAALLDSETELAQPLMPNTLRGEMVKYVGVWLPEGGFVQVGGYDTCVHNLSRTAVTGLTHNWHVSGEDGYIVITTTMGTIISHPDMAREGGQWREPGDESYWRRRDVEGFPVYVVIPKKTAILERRLLVGTSAFLNGAALVLAAFLVGIVIAAYVRAQLRAQRAKEMSMASDIQESSIPRTFPPFPDEKRVDIYADMETAREVGGDFYDFFISGTRKITFLVADVSGKGVPAALFMMRAKSVVKSVAQTGKPVAEVATAANNALCESNSASMFVTAWIGEIDLDSGIVSYVNLGHNPPLLIRGGSPEYLKGKTGIALGAMPGFTYAAQEVRLEPGDMLYLYTDGVTEQTNTSGEMFGEQRLKAAMDGRCDVEDVVGTILSAVRGFGEGVEQADDITQLAIRYNGAG